MSFVCRVTFTSGEVEFFDVTAVVYPGAPDGNVLRVSQADYSLLLKSGGVARIPLMAVRKLETDKPS